MYRILLVEDDKNISEMLCDYFTEKSSNKIVIDVAENGKKRLGYGLRKFLRFAFT